MRQRRRKKRRNYTLQALWIVVAVVATAGLIIGYKLGNEKNPEGTSPITNEGDQPLDSEDIDRNEDQFTQISTVPTKKPTFEPPLEVILTPTVVPPMEIDPTLIPTITIAPTLAPTITLEPTITPEPTLTPGPTIAPTVAPSEQETDDELDKEEEQDSPKMIALTFDDGPYPPVTERIIQTLKENGAKATFFMMGNRMSQYQSSVELAYESGNQIASHTYSHKDLTKLSLKDMKYEVDHANECINNIVPVGEAYLRPPYGRKNDIMKENVGVPMIFWSVDTQDWSSRDGESVYQEIMNNVQDGDIILMHDLYPSTADAMDLVIPKLIQEGYQLVTVKELLEAKGIDICDGNVYYNGRK